MDLFGELDIGEHFIYQGHTLKMIDTIKVGCCSPQWNAQDINDPEIYSYFHCGIEIDIIPTLRSHSKSREDILTLYPKSIILIDDTLLTHWPEIRVIPCVTDRFVEFEDTDTWLAYFNLGTLYKKPYCEKLRKKKWIPQI